jgi:hypothetical protein
MKTVRFLHFFGIKAVKALIVFLLVFSVLNVIFTPEAFAQKEDYPEAYQPKTSLEPNYLTASATNSPTIQLAPAYQDYQNNFLPNKPEDSYRTQQAIWPIEQVQSGVNDLGKALSEFKDALDPNKMGQNILRWITQAIEGIFRMLAAAFAGEDNITKVIAAIELSNNPQAYLTPEKRQELQEVFNRQEPSGIIALTSYAIDKSTGAVPQMINNQEYLAYVNPFKVKEAYAQTGRDKLSNSILDLWTTLRNISYAFLVLVLVIIGFMIMLRAKVDPRTTVGMVNSLPRVVVALILITFSFPIGALFIDLIQVLLNLVGCSTDLYCLNGVQYNPNIFMDMSRGIITSGLQAAFQVPVPGGIGILVYIVVLVMFLLIVFVTVVRVGLAFLTEWVTLFLTILFSPLLLLGVAIPGGPSVKGWIKRLLSPVLCIVAMYTVIAIALRISHSADVNNLGHLASTQGLGINFPTWRSNPIIPDYIGAFNSLAALGILLFTPAVCTNIKKALDVMMSDQGAIDPMSMQREAGKVRGTAGNYIQVKGGALPGRFGAAAGWLGKALKIGT